MVQIINSIKEAAYELGQGNVISIPTETVYGLAADAENQQAVNKVFSIKKRPANHPLIIHVSDIQMAERYSVDIPEYAYRLMKEFWPGPLTFVLKKSNITGSYVTGGQDTVAIRAPKHHVCRDLIQSYGKGLVAPSANLYGHISTTTSEHVTNEFNDEFNYVLEGGACEIGIESTIIDATQDSYFNILRHGVISKQQLEKASCGIPCQDNRNDELRVSGDKLSHYAPNKPVHVLESSQISKINYNLDKVLLIIPSDQREQYFHLNVMMETYQNQAELAANLYSWLRKGEVSFDYTIIQRLPLESDWDALRDRIKKAAYKYTGQLLNYM